ncbi:MAG: hypothetical protein QM775_02515 [Pirellulales bacterium]
MSLNCVPTRTFTWLPRTTPVRSPTTSTKSLEIQLNAPSGGRTAHQPPGSCRHTSTASPCRIVNTG